MKLFIYSVGKTKESWLEEALFLYIKRLKPVIETQLIIAKSNEQLLSLIQKETHLIGLDPEGKEMRSEEFSSFLMKSLEKGGAKTSFLIGGAEGIPNTLKKNIPLISLSKMTFTHQMARLILMEQIYRGFEIAKGSEYHK
jgi:23S rRNA (pseudouridine1915-N3)-methyltransferase